MATIIRTPAFLIPPLGLDSTSLETPKRLSFSLNQRRVRPFHVSISNHFYKSSLGLQKLVHFSASEETTKINEFQETEIRDISHEGGIANMEERPASPIIPLLQAWKEALASNNESKVTEIEAFLQSLEDEKISLANKVAALSVELSVERDLILRIIADFDNFRKRTERERLSLVTNAKGEVVESLLAVLGNFERAKAQIKVETQGEEKINDS